MVEKLSEKSQGKLSEKMSEKKRVGIFIDGANIYHGIKDKRINLNVFKEWLINNDDCVELHYFNNVGPGTISNFFHALERRGFKIHILKTVQNKITKEFHQKGTDVNLAVQAVSKHACFDKFVLVSGDYDFMPVVDFMKHAKKEIEVVSFKQCMHPFYNRFEHRLLDDFMELEGAIIK